jgi:hypothetical protein
MIQFLDIIIDDRFPRSRISRRIVDTLREHPKPTVPDTTTTPQDTSHVISSADIPSNIQMADVAPRPSGLEEMLGANMTLTLLVVFFALCLCCYFIMKYRKSHSDAV